MKPEIEAVVRLQSIDDRTAALQREIATLPKHVAEIERKLESHSKRLDSDRAALAGSLKKRKSLEDDIRTHEAKITKLKEQLLQAKTNEQYKAFQNEIAYAQDQIRKAEDQILDIMSETEPLEVNVKAAEAALAKEKKAVEEEKQRARNRTAEDEAALGKALAERQQIVGSVQPQILTHYERSRKRWRNSGIADATSGRCDGCHIALRPQYFQELKQGDRVLGCESCGRILYYNPPVNLEHELHSKV